MRLVKLFINEVTAFVRQIGKVAQKLLIMLTTKNEGVKEAKMNPQTYWRYVPFVTIKSTETQQNLLKKDT